MTDRLATARVKVERAKKHLAEVNSVATDYLATKPYSIVRETNPQTGKDDHILRIHRQPPEQLACAIGDTVHNARSALDHLACAISGRDDSQFPIRRDPKTLPKAIRSDIQGARVRAVQLILGLNPYKGANNPLWAIHCLDIIDKHRVLLTVGAINPSVQLDMAAALRVLGPKTPGMEHMSDLPPFYIGLKPAEVEWLEDGAVLFAGDPEVDMGAKFPLHIAINEPEVPIMEAINPFLPKCIHHVEEIVGLIDKQILGNP